MTYFWWSKHHLLYFITMEYVCGFTCNNNIPLFSNFKSIINKCDTFTIFSECKIYVSLKYYNYIKIYCFTCIITEQREPHCFTLLCIKEDEISSNIFVEMNFDSWTEWWCKWWADALYMHAEYVSWYIKINLFLLIDF